MVHVLILHDCARFRVISTVIRDLVGGGRFIVADDIVDVLARESSSFVLHVGDELLPLSDFAIEHVPVGLVVVYFVLLFDIFLQAVVAAVQRRGGHVVIVVVQVLVAVDYPALVEVFVIADCFCFSRAWHRRLLAVNFLAIIVSLVLVDIDSHRAI